MIVEIDFYCPQCINLMNYEDRNPLDLKLEEILENASIIKIKYCNIHSNTNISTRIHKNSIEINKIITKMKLKNIKITWFYCDNDFIILYNETNLYKFGKMHVTFYFNEIVYNGWISSTEELSR